MKKRKLRSLTQEEIKKWILPKKSLIHAIKVSHPNRSILKIAGDLLSDLYEHSEIPYYIMVTCKESLLNPEFDDLEYSTYCQEIILDWPPKKKDVSDDNLSSQWSGEIVQHFKRETLTDEEKATNRYLYQIRGLAQHTETGEKLVVYQALYPPFATYARPADMFFSKVDKDKYPHIKQKRRMEIIKLSEEG